MRSVWVALLVPALGCASTVSRLPGEIPTKTGESKSACESTEWLVLAPTKSEEVSHSGRSSVARKDGFGVYKVGEDHPEKIPDLGERLGSSPIIDRHQKGVERHDQKQWIGASLGAAGLIALGIGSYLFATSFETKKTTAADGTTDEEQEINGGRIGVGTGLMVGGIGLGIAGLVVSPSSAERAKADQARYVFTPPEDDPKEIESMVDRHNTGVRDRCAR